MNLTIGEVAELPLCAAMFDGDVVVARTPEWKVATAGAVTYRARRVRLVVNTDPAPNVTCAQILGRLLEEVDGAAAGLPRRQALRVAMLAESLRLVAGRDVETSGTADDVLEHACAGIAARTALHVAVTDAAAFAVPSPAAAALVLVQLAANAERHDAATTVELSAARSAFAVRWRASTSATRAVTARRHDDRRRWGLGFARIAADCVGGVLHPPVPDGDGVRTAIFETGLGRLALPLALVSGAQVSKSTRAWDEETGLLPGQAVPAESRVARCVAAAAGSPSAVAAVAGWCARTGRAGTWVAIPRDGVVDRARDVIDGMVHERPLWDGVPEPTYSRIVALAALVGATLGVPLDRVPGTTWNRRASEVARAFGLTAPLPPFHGVGAVDPRVALFLASECAGTLEADGDELVLRVRPERRDDPLLSSLLAPGEPVIRLS